MIRLSVMSLVAGVLLAATAFGQSPAARFRWQAGQTLNYRVEHTSSASEVIDEQKVETQTKLNLERRWQVLEVDSAGTARLQMTLLSLRMEMKKPNGETILFDSRKPDPANADVNKQMMQYVGKPIATIRIDSRGQLLDVKVHEATFGSAARLQADLPFKIVWPDEAPQAGQAWERTCKLVVEPPLGAGESYDAVQKLTCQSIDGNIVRLGAVTTVRNPPAAVLARVPLISMQPTGTITFDAAAGRMKKAELKCSGEVVGYRKEGGKYVFNSSYVEELVEK